MTTLVFVPLNDELLEKFPDLIHERPVPYQTDLPCLHGLASAPGDGQERQEARHVATR